MGYIMRHQKTRITLAIVFGVLAIAWTAHANPWGWGKIPSVPKQSPPISIVTTLPTLFPFQFPPCNSGYSYGDPRNLDLMDKESQPATHVPEAEMITLQTAKLPVGYYFCVQGKPIPPNACPVEFKVRPSYLGLGVAILNQYDCMKDSPIQPNEIVCGTGFKPANTMDDPKKPPWVFTCEPKSISKFYPIKCGLLAAETPITPLLSACVPVK